MGFFGDLIGDITSVVTDPIKAVVGAVSGGAAKVLAPVAKVATAAISTAGQTITGVSSAADGMVSHVLTPLSTGIGGGGVSCRKRGRRRC